MSEAKAIHDGEETLWTDPELKTISTARPMRGFTALLRALIDECRVHFTEDGIRVTATDSANIGMVELEWPAGGFDVYRYEADATELVMGLNVKMLEKFLKFAREPQDDPVSLYVNEGEHYQFGVRATRPDHRVQRSTRWYHIEPDSIRLEPDLPDLTKEYGWKAHVDPLPFRDAVTQLHETADHARMKGRKSTFTLAGGTIETYDADNMIFPDAAECQPWDAQTDGDVPDGWEDTHSKDTSLFALSYLNDVAKAIRSAKMDRITIGWGDEFPITVKFSHDEWGINGQYLIAPLSSD